MPFARKQLIVWMEQALAAADRRRGFCAPNPAVGAVLVSELGEVIAVGEHWACGEPHAEVVALQKAGGAARGATLLVTLEPCCHTGRTGPCTAAIIAAGVSRVYYGFRDPNPRVSGGGAAALHASGIPCEHLSLTIVDEFYRSYAYWTATGRPFVRAKLAMSADGMIAAADGSPLVISGGVAAEFTAQGRRHADAILTTANTVIADNPRLNVRLGTEVQSRPVYVVDSGLRCGDDILLLHTARALIFFHGNQYDPNILDIWMSQSVACEKIAENDQGLLLDDVMAKIGADGVHELWVEVGSICLQSLIKSGLLDELLIYVSPINVGDGYNAFLLPEQLTSLGGNCKSSSLGDDQLYTFTFPED